jgi:hypothetical protein
VLLAAAAVSYSIVTGGAIGLSAALAASSEAANPNLPAQTSSACGVTIKVTPKNLASNARWVALPALEARRLYLETASLSVLGYDHDLDEPVIRLWNDARHP